MRRRRLPTTLVADRLIQVSDARTRNLAAAAAVGLLVAVAFVMVVGVITDAIDTPLRQRQTPLFAIDYPIWAANAVLLGGMAGFSSYLRRQRQSSNLNAMYGGGFLAAFAISCPLCNGLLVAAFGAGGVLSFIEPARPVLGGLATLFLAIVLYRRVRAYRAECVDCEIHAPAVEPVKVEA